MQLVLHAPFGSRINKAWGLALRKRFCRQFNFELQAAATEDALLLSLGPQHSFPLADVFRYLHPATTRDVLVQAFLDAPVFQTRWRWNTTISLAVPRRARRTQGAAAAPAHARRRSDGGGVSRRGGVPREHPGRSPDPRSSAGHARRSATASRRRWTSTGCARVLERIHRGELRLRRARHAGAVAVRARDPERAAVRVPRRCAARGAAERTRCSRGARPSRQRRDLGALDAAAIERVRDEARPDPRDADELHDALLTAGFLHRSGSRGDRRADVPAAADRRSARADGLAAHVGRSGACAVVRRGAAARAPRHPSGRARSTGQSGAAAVPRARSWTRDGRDRRAAARPALRSSARTTAASPGRLARRRRRATPTAALLALESEGVVLRGRFTPAACADRSSGATARCSRASTATRSTGCARRSSRSARPTSCASCSPGSTSSRRTQADRARRAPRDRRACSTASSSPPAPGSAPCCRRASTLRAVDARHAVPHRRGRLGAAVARAPSTRAAARAGDAGRAVPARARRRVAGAAAAGCSEREPPADAQLRGDVLLGVLALRRGASFFRDLATACAPRRRRSCGARSASSSPGSSTSDGFAGLRALVVRRPQRRARAPRDRRRDFGRPLVAPIASRIGRDGRRARGRGRDAGAGRCCAATASCSAGC